MPNDDLLHMHTFSHSTARPPGEVVMGVGALGDRGVRFAARFLGSFQVYTHSAFQTLADAQDLLDELWSLGLRTEQSTEVRVSRIMGPKRGSPDFCALIRIRPEVDPFTLLDRLDDYFGPLVDPDAYWYGAAVVTGRGYDLLVDLGRPSFEELFRAVLEDLRNVEGIGRTDTSWADLRKNAIRNT